MASTQAPRPLILIRGFGGTDVADEQRNAYQGFNDGTVYPGRRGDNFIYEGFVLRCLKSPLYRYSDATNVVGYFSGGIPAPVDVGDWDEEDVTGQVAIDPQTAKTVVSEAGPGTIWVYRYYDLTPRSLRHYGGQLQRLITLIEKAMVRQGLPFSGVDIVAHSMGGLVVRQALEVMYEDGDSARRLVHKVVTLGTPHRGIAFQTLPEWLLRALPNDPDDDDAADELAAFRPKYEGFKDVGTWFDVDRILTVVGTNYRTYSAHVASWANRLSSLFDEGSLATNRSDGLVKHSSAQLPGAPRTFIHKCHGGPDSVVTARESYEIAMRFFHGSHHVRLWLDEAQINRGFDFLGKSEFFFGVTIKPRGVDFELFHQSVEAENCYGPFAKPDLSDDVPPLQEELLKPYSERGDETTWWAAGEAKERLIWEGWVDEKNVPDPASPDMVFRLDIYVGERDSRGIGFSDNVVFRKQYYVQVVPGSPMAVFVHTGEDHLRSPSERTTAPMMSDEAAPSSSETAPASASSPPVQRAEPSQDGYRFRVHGTGFSATFRFDATRVEGAGKDT